MWPLLFWGWGGRVWVKTYSNPFYIFSVSQYPQPLTYTPLIAAAEVVIGCQGSVRRKKKVIVREHLGDEKKVQAVLKKIGLSEIPSIDEVCLMLIQPRSGYGVVSK